MQILALLCNLGSIICFIMVVIKLFQQKGVLHGILGILCSLYTFIWGWIEAGRLNIKNLMLIWTACIVAGCALAVLSMPHH